MKINFRPRTLELWGPRKADFSLRDELLAGVTVGLIALPLSIALGIASIPSGAETPLPAPALGIFTAILAGAIIALLGGSRVQIGGPTAAFVPIILLIVMEHGYAGLLIATMMAGVILIVMGLTGLGSLIKYIPWPVTSGFTTGIAVAITITQVPDFTGMHVTGGMPREFVERAGWLAEHLGASNPYALGIGIACVLIIYFWPKLKIKMIPGSIVAMLGATVLVAVLGWGDSHGVATIGSKFGDGAIPRGLPWPPKIPEFNLALLRDLIGPATAIALLGAIESLLSAVVADGLSGDRHDSNTELVAQGIANLCCPLLGGFPPRARSRAPRPTSATAGRRRWPGSSTP